MADLELCFAAAAKLARLIRTRKVSATEVMRAFIAQIERVNPRVNAIVTFLPERALKEARALDRRLAKPRTAPAGSLAGLPIAYKDLVATKGIRTTMGSPIYRDHVPAEDALLVERLQSAGAITIGKTNTPEFGAGSQTIRHGEDLRWFVGRGGGCGRLRNAALRRRLGSRRVSAKPGQLLQRRRIPALQRPCPCPSVSEPVVQHGRAGPHRAHGRGRGVAALGDGRARRARAGCLQRAR